MLLTSSSVLRGFVWVDEEGVEATDAAVRLEVNAPLRTGRRGMVVTEGFTNQ